jgi:hypothetical protein
MATTTGVNVNGANTESGVNANGAITRNARASTHGMSGTDGATTDSRQRSGLLTGLYRRLTMKTRGSCALILALLSFSNIQMANAAGCIKGMQTICWWMV